MMNTKAMRLFNFTFIQQQEEPAEEVIVHIDGYYCDDNMETVTQHWFAMERMIRTQYMTIPSTKLY